MKVYEMASSESPSYDLIAASLAFIGATFAAWRKRDFLFRSFRSMMEFASKADQILREVKRNSDQIEAVQRELRVDASTSLKDLVVATHDMAHLAEMRTKSIQSTISIPTFECEPEHGRCIWVNSAICELFGLEEHEMLNNGWLKAVDEQERAEVFRKWKEAIRMDIPWSWTYQVINQRTGKITKVRSSAVAFRASNGKVLLYGGTVVPERTCNES